MTKATFTGDGSTSRFSFSFPYVLDEDVKVSVDGVDLLTSQYALFGTSEMDITDGAAVIAANGLEIIVYRYSGGAIPNTVFQPGPVRSKDLNEAIEQAAYIAEEARSTAGEATTAVVTALADSATAIAAVNGFSGGGATTLLSALNQASFVPVGDTEIGFLESEGKFYIRLDTGGPSFLDAGATDTWYQIVDTFQGDLKAANNLSDVTAATARNNLDVPGRSETTNVFTGVMNINSRLRVGTANLDAIANGTAELAVGSSAPAGVVWDPAATTQAIIANNGTCGLTILGKSTNFSLLTFGNELDEDAGSIEFDHTNEQFRVQIGNLNELTITTTDTIVNGTLSALAVSGSWVASQAEAEAGVINSRIMTPLRVAQAITALTPVTVGTAQATCFFDSLTSGTPSIKSSTNISSITDNAVGHYTMNFTTAMPTANYTVLANGKGQDGTVVASAANSMIVHPITYATGSVALIAYTQANLAKADATLINFAVFL